MPQTMKNLLTLGKCQIISYLKKKRGKTEEKGKRKTFPEA